MAFKIIFHCNSQNKKKFFNFALTESTCLKEFVGVKANCAQAISKAIVYIKRCTQLSSIESFIFFSFSAVVSEF